MRERALDLGDALSRRVASLLETLSWVRCCDERSHLLTYEAKKGIPRAGTSMDFGIQWPSRARVCGDRLVVRVTL